MISDIVLLKELPASIKDSIEAYIGCVSGAIMKDEYLEKIKEAGFQDVRIIDETIFPVELMANDSTAKMLEIFGAVAEELKQVSSSVASIKVQGVKQLGKT